MTIYELIQRAADLRGRYEVDSITPEEVGGLAQDTLTYISILEQNLQALGIRKTYASEADMNADTAPMGDNGMPIRFGQLVMVTATGKIYAYQAPGWKAVSDAALPVSIGNVVGKRGDRLGNVLGDIGVADPSVEGFTLNDYTTSGTYRILGDRTNGNDGMPIANEGGGHRVDAVLTVLDASISSSETCVTQMLVLSNRVAGDGNMYIRTAKGTMAEIQSGEKWETWQKMVGQWEKGMVADATELDTWTESGMYSAMMTAQSSTRGLTFNPGDTLFVITINGYDSERLSSTITAQCTQFLYRLPAYYEGVNTGVAKAEQYVGTGLWTGSRYSWGDWKRLADADDVAQLSKNINTNTKGIENLQKEVATKQQELTLTVLDNGNIRIGNLKGQTKDFMPATPSGDPMHYAYEAMGAVWNGTGKDIVYDASVDYTLSSNKNKKPFFLDWGDSYTHKAGYWLMNEVGDLTNADMREILLSRPPIRPVDDKTYWMTSIQRTNRYNNFNAGSTAKSYKSVACNALKIEVLSFWIDKTIIIKTNDIHYAFSPAPKLKKITNEFNIKEAGYSAFVFYSCPNLEYIKFSGLSTNFNIPCPKLHKQSVKWLIENETGDNTKIIELHPDVYAVMSEDADIQAALEAHPLVTITPYES